MEWQQFWIAWTQRLLDICLSVKVWVLISTFMTVFFGISIGTAAATIITTVIGIREGYKVIRSRNGRGINDKV
jgi:uncharacterized membrane-anchored protein